MYQVLLLRLVSSLLFITISIVIATTFLVAIVIDIKFVVDIIAAINAMYILGATSKLLIKPMFHFTLKLYGHVAECLHVNL